MKADPYFHFAADRNLDRLLAENIHRRWNCRRGPAAAFWPRRLGGLVTETNASSGTIIKSRAGIRCL